MEGPRFDAGLDVNGPQLDRPQGSKVRKPLLNIEGPRLDIQSPKKRKPLLNIEGPRFDGGLDVHGPQFDRPQMDIQGPRFDGGLDVHGSQLDRPQLDIQGPRFDGGLDVHGPQFNRPQMDIQGPRFDGGLDVHGPQFDRPQLNIQGPRFDIDKPNLNIDGPRTDMQGPKVDTNVPLPSLGELLNPEYNVNAPELNMPRVEAKGDIDLSKPKIEIPPLNIQKEKPKELLRKQSFRPVVEIPGIDLETTPLNDVNVDLENPPIDIPPVDTNPPEIELKPKVVLPSLDNYINENDPNIEIIAPQASDIPTPRIAEELNLPKKIDEEPEIPFEPPQIDSDVNAGEQPPFSPGEPQESNVPAFRKKDDFINRPSFNVEGPDDRKDFDDNLHDADVDVDLGKGKIDDEAKIGEDEQMKEEEPKEKPVKIDNYISEDVYAPIHEARRIPKIKKFKGFPKKQY